MHRSEKLAEHIVKAGQRVLTSHPVASIAHDTNGVTVVCRNGKTFRCHRVIVAMPPTSASKLHWSPQLPYHREQLHQRNFMGCIIKVLVLYARPFWRLNGFSGQVACDTSTGPVFNTVDDCYVAADGSTQPALVAFINGDPARQWGTRPAQQRREAVLAQLARWFGQEALSPVEYAEYDWGADPWTRGCPIGMWSVCYPLCNG